MLFHVQMQVNIPHDFPAEKAEELKVREKSHAQALQQSGQWRHLWRIAGQYANVSVFDVQSNAQLHELLSSLPLFPFMEIQIQPLLRHPSSIHEGDQ